MINENEFFRNATLRICGNLEIEEGLRACINYLSRHMPADRLYLETHERELGAMRIIARASADEGAEGRHRHLVSVRLNVRRHPEEWECRQCEHDDASSVG